MELTISFLVSFLFISLLLIFLSKPTNNKNKNTPPCPPSLPILGHLHLLKKPLHRSLAELSSVHGPALLLRFGTRPVLVISSLSFAEECFTKNDLAFASRPQLPSSKSLTYNYTTLISSPYGPHWRNLRRVATIELFSSARLHSLSHIRHDEAKSLISGLHQDYDSKWKKVELKPKFFGLALNTMMRMIAGKRYYGKDAKRSEEANRFKDMVEEALTLVGTSNPSDFIPMLRWVDFGGVKKRVRRVVEKREVILQGLIDEARGKGHVNGEAEKKEYQNIIELLLSLQQEEPDYYTDAVIKALIMSLLVAGTDTSTETLEWAMSLLLNHPESMQKARNEIDANVANGRLMEERDLPNLPYLQAIIKETLRMCPVVPLLVPHESQQECTVGGYTVPLGTILLVNAWAIQRDPSVWTDPLEFRPERFLDEGDGGGGSRIIPFGMGRRRCAGEGLAMRVVGLVLGSLIQCFVWERVGEELVDMRERGGITLPKLITLEAMYRPRESMRDVLSEI